ncbi:MAG: hypothetical protein M1817_005976 [Caeruleum heppii]|nr:MAG: hypothetical protein M1817_005976 [Caeruleum heppii]
MSSPESTQSYERSFAAYGTPPYPIYSYSGPGAAYLAESPNFINLNMISEPLSTDGDRKRRRSGAKDGSPQIHSRRRAQNRASQRAFRDRKEKHVKDLEHRLAELEDKNGNLEQAYADLSAEHSKLRQKLESPQRPRLNGETALGDLIEPKQEEEENFALMLTSDLISSGPSFYFDSEMPESPYEVGYKDSLEANP